MKRVLVISLAAVLALSLSIVLLPAQPATAGDVFKVPSAYSTIQAGINAAEADGGGTVLVAAGTYYENITLKSGVEVVGDGSSDTIISGVSSDPQVPVVTANQRTDAKLDGFTITNGSGTQSGAGIAIQENSSNVTISNCVITGNTADLSGGGIAIADSSATIVNCTIIGNTANKIDEWGGNGGGIYITNSSPTIINCIIANNTAINAGGGVRNNEGTLTVTNTIIYDNTAYFKGGGLNNIGGTVKLKNSTISKNTSTGTWLPQPTSLSGGGGISTDSPVTLINSIVNGNTATAGGDITAEGGGIRVGGPNGKLTIINSTIVNNTAKTSGGAIRGGPTTVTNSILWGNTAPQFKGTPAISYSLVEGGYPGIGNISGDPQFVDDDGPDDIVGTLDDDLHLQATSPCIDAGDNSAPNLPDTDKDGNPRIVNDIVDMGAYEATAAIITYTITATAGSGGSISPSGEVTADAGDNQTLAILPDTGYHVEDVLVDSTSIGVVSEYTFTNVTDNHIIHASFAIDTITIEIDIKPGSDPNSVNLGKGVIPVAILTTADFDAASVNVTTVLFGKEGNGAAPVHYALEDVDDDGDTDMILQFKTQETGIGESDTEATLTGQTLDGKNFKGTDSVRIVPPKGKKGK